MKKIIFFLTIVSTFIISCGTNSDKSAQNKDKENPLYKQDNETKEMFVNRLYPKRKLTHLVLEGTFGSNPLPKIIFFFVDSTTDIIKGVYLQKQDNGVYYPVNIGQLEHPEGMVPNQISSVFFANADGDKEKELVVLQPVFGREMGELTGDHGEKIEQSYLAEEPSTVLVFDDKEETRNDSLYLNKLAGISKKLSDSNVRNAKDVRDTLKKLGY